jgi:hypothetical protein
LVKVFNIKVVLNTLIYLQKTFHIFKKLLIIFSQFSFDFHVDWKLSKENRNSFFSPRARKSLRPVKTARTRAPAKAHRPTAAFPIPQPSRPVVPAAPCSAPAPASGHRRGNLAPPLPTTPPPPPAPFRWVLPGACPSTAFGVGLTYRARPPACTRAAAATPYRRAASPPTPFRQGASGQEPRPTAWRPKQPRLNLSRARQWPPAAVLPAARAPHPS